MTRGTMRRRRTMLGATLTTMLVLTACDSDGGVLTPPVERPAVELVEVALEADRLLPDAQARAAATLRARGGAVLTDRAVQWSSSNESVATIDAQGLVRAHEAGMTQITATSEGRQGVVVLTVDALAAAAIRLPVQQVELGAGETRQIEVEVRAQDGRVLAGWPVSWHSSNAAVVRVDELGRLTPGRAGTTTVLARAGPHVAQLQVTVRARQVAGSYGLQIGAGNERVRCQLSGMKLELRQDGAVLSGEVQATPNGGQTGCGIIGTVGPFVTPMPPHGPFVGWIDGDEIVLRFEFIDWELRGTWRGTGFSGQAELYDTHQGELMRWAGSFGAGPMPSTP